MMVWSIGGGGMEQEEEGQGFEAVNTESVSRDNEPWRR